MPLPKHRIRVGRSLSDTPPSREPFSLLPGVRLKQGIIAETFCAGAEAKETAMEIDYLTIQETAVRARMAPKTLYNWISLGRIGLAEGVCHVGRTGRKVLIHWSTFEATVLRGNLRGAA